MSHPDDLVSQLRGRLAVLRRLYLHYSAVSPSVSKDMAFAVESLESAADALEARSQDEAEKALSECEHSGIFDVFSSPADAIRQMSRYIAEAEEAVGRAVEDPYGQSLANVIDTLHARRVKLQDDLYVALEARSLDSEDLDWLEANGKDICIYGPDDRWGWEMSWALRSGGHAGGTLRQAIRAARAQEPQVTACPDSTAEQRKTCAVLVERLQQMAAVGAWELSTALWEDEVVPLLREAGIALGAK